MAVRELMKTSEQENRTFNGKEVFVCLSVCFCVCSLNKDIRAR